MTAHDCELCRREETGLVAADPHLRVVLIDDVDYPGYVRVIWNAHVREMSDLDRTARDHFMLTVFAVEEALRAVLQPLKVNLASLGNQTPHLHWHVIPRFADDAHFPGPIWSAAQRAADPQALEKRAARLPALRRAIIERLTS
jgi:diadenosine tetraphosphate (Ap4A) HIT family hydrolase